MPLSTGATWPSLANRTASAADVNSKFEWAEGHRYPQINGVLTDNTYGIGNTSSVWDSLYLSGNIVIAGNTVTSKLIGIDAWATLKPSAYGDYVTSTGYNISSIGRYFGVGGTFAGYAFNFIVPMQSDKYSVAGASSYRTYIMALTTTYCRLISITSAGVYTDGTYFGIMVKE